LNTLCHITRTPGVAPGAQLDFATELESFLKKQINQNKIDIDDPGLTFRIKISEDGAKMTKLTIFIVISCSVFNNDEDPMSSKGKRYCQYLIYPIFLKLPIALAYMLLQVSLNAWCTFTGTIAIMTCCLPIYNKFRGMNATHECMHLIKL